MTGEAGWRPGWRAWTVAAVVVVLATPVVAGLAIRLSGIGRCEQVVAERAETRDATFADLVALAPEVDETVQERWRAWAEARQRAWRAHDDRPRASEWLDSLRTPPPSELAAYYDGDTDARIGLELLRLRPRLGRFGWLRAAARSGRSGFADIAAIPSANLLSARALSENAGYHALADHDPAAGLADLELLAEALSTPDSLIDAMTRLALIAQRDTTCLRLVAVDRLPDEFARRWLAEGIDFAAIAADGLRGERLAVVEPAMRFERGQPIALALSYGRAQALGAWLWTPRDLALAYRRLAEEEAWLRGVSARWPAGTTPMHGLAGYILPNLLESTVMTIQFEAVHRAVTLVARLRLAGETPADHAAAIAVLGADAFAATAHRLALRYERPAEHVMRIVVDPASPRPAPIDAARLADFAKASGAPPRIPGKENARLKIDRASVEVETP